MPHRSGPLRKVVETFDQPSRSDPSVSIPKQRLECGHVVADNALYYGNEASFRIRRLTSTMPSGPPLRRRCYECGKEKAAAQVAAIRSE